MRLLDKAMQSDEITISCHVHEIPSFVERDLARLYGNLFSSLPFFRVFKPMEDVSTYVVRQGGQVITVILFRYKDGKIDVFNEMIRIDETEMHRFSRYMFSRFDRACVISFKAIQTNLKKLPFPFQQHNAKDDFVIALSRTPHDYTARLGKATRTNIKRYRKRLVQNFPSFSHHFYENKDIEEHHIRAIIDLSKSRISAKKKKFGVDEKETQGLIRLAKMCGMVTVVRINGRLCAGTISYRVGSGYVAVVNAHDSKYDEYWLGTLCYYLTICESIVRGGKQFHMGGGQYEYKKRLFGVRQDMDRIEIYRSHGQRILHFDRVVMTMCAGYFRKLKVWLLAREKSVISQLVIRSWYIFHKLKARSGK